MLPIVPMFHVNAWGLPFTCTWLGCNQVYPGPHLDPQSVLSLLVSERVTLTGGVPTVWLGVLQELDRNPGKYDLSHLRAIIIGGSAAPLAMIRAYEERHNLKFIHAWGMTEMSPARHDLQRAELDEGAARSTSSFGIARNRARRCRSSKSAAAPRPGSSRGTAQTMGELEVRGPWVASQYYNTKGADPRFTEDGWFKTGDIVTIAPAAASRLPTGRRIW